MSMSMTLQVSAQMSRLVSAGPSMVSKEMKTSFPSSSSSSTGVSDFRAISGSENDVKRALWLEQFMRLWPPGIVLACATREGLLTSLDKGPEAARRGRIGGPGRPPRCVRVSWRAAGRRPRPGSSRTHDQATPPPSAARRLGSGDTGDHDVSLPRAVNRSPGEARRRGRLTGAGVKNEVEGWPTFLVEVADVACRIIVHIRCGQGRWHRRWIAGDFLFMGEYRAKERRAEQRGQDLPEGSSLADSSSGLGGPATAWSILEWPDRCTQAPRRTLTRGGNSTLSAASTWSSP